MGQFFQDKNVQRKIELPTSLFDVEQKGFHNAVFSLSEVKKLLKSTGNFINIAKYDEKLIG